ncbi:MAG: phosphatidylserine decarboxylase [Planctomycetota bacterium]|jgi:phosphatidylserine decarboxylase
MPLTSYGLREWGIMLLVGGGLIAAAAAMGWWIVAGVLLLALLAGLAFFRDPVRRVRPPARPGELLAPADGRISAIERVPTHEAVDGPAVVIRIYLSVFNVHVNRCPCPAEVLGTRHQPGRHLDVRDPASARENEWLLMSLRRTDDGVRIGVRQIAGLVARRIVCGVTTGRRLDRGQKYGMIKFGSSTELIVPETPGLEIAVDLGDRVAAGRTLMAVLPLAAASASPEA